MIRTPHEFMLGEATTKCQGGWTTGNSFGTFIVSKLTIQDTHESCVDPRRLPQLQLEGQSCHDRPDISEGLAGVYLKFKQLKVPARSINNQPPTINSQGSGHGFGLRANDPTRWQMD